MAGSWAGEGGKPGGGDTTEAAPEQYGKELLDSVRLMERSGLKGACCGLPTGLLQMLDNQKVPPMSSSLMYSELRLCWEEEGRGGEEKKEADRFKQLCAGSLR